MDRRSLIFIFGVTLSFLAIQTWFAPPVTQPQATVAMTVEKPLVAWQAPTEIAAASPVSGSETFYVLENKYQQLVFSTRGGALAEINLPFKSAENQKSIVREIDIDRQILKNSPENARFPLKPYYALSPSGEKVFHEESSLGGYYPLLRRSTTKALPQYYALSTSGENRLLAETTFKVTRFEPNLIQFQGSADGRKITKTYTILQESDAPYCIQLDLQIDGNPQGIWISSGVPDVELVAGSYAPLLRYQISKPGGLEVDSIDLPKKEMISSTSSSPNWISNSNGFFATIVDPLPGSSQGYQAMQIEGTILPTRLSLVDAGYDLYPPIKYPGYATYLPLSSETMQSFRLFAGPLDHSLLKDLDDHFEDRAHNYNPEYTLAQSIQGWFSFISQPFTKFLFFLMQIFHFLTGSWAVSIVLLTVALKAMMYPLNAWSFKSSLKMQEISPKIKALQERYKNDPKKAQLETMTLYREAKINPLTGCLPVLLQMPFLFGMFYLLKSSFPLRGAPFIPGWIDDLAAPDVVFTWGEPLWFIGNEFHLLPIIVGLTMFIQQRLTMSGPKKGEPVTDAQKQQTMMTNMMSIFLTVMFYSFPSGLNLYFIFSNLLGVGQQWWTKKKMKTS
jgi:YidC/Oxa1 family membrane protein insertase